MGLMDKARQTAEQARAGVLGERNGDGADPDAPPPPPGARASAALNAFVEKINPGLLADLIIHATSAQEKANKALKDKGSQYRISEMYLTASIPPQIGFYIARMGDAEDGEAAPPVKAPVKPSVKKVAGPAKKRAPRPAGP